MRPIGGQHMLNFLTGEPQRPETLASPTQRRTRINKNLMHSRKKR